jgi:uncharacterized membrane protein
LLVAIGTAVLLHSMPLWRRSQLWFGVTVPTGFDGSPAGQAALRMYRTAVWCFSFIAGVAVLATAGASPRWLMPAALVGQLLAASLAFAAARRRIWLHGARTAGTRSALLADDQTRMPGGAISALVPFSMLAASAFYLRANWSSMPDRIAVHWTIAGGPDRWADRTGRTVYGPLIACAITTIVVLLLGQLILRGSPRARVPGTEDWNARFRLASLRLLVAATWGISLLFSIFAIAPTLDLAGARTWLGLAPLALVAVLVPFIWQVVRISLEPNSGGDGTPDACWKLGQIYYNPDDPAIVVAKRFGVGYTINLANRAAWLLLGVLGALALVATRL